MLYIKYNETNKMFAAVMDSIRFNPGSERYAGKDTNFHQERKYGIYDLVFSSRGGISTGCNFFSSD